MQPDASLFDRAPVPISLAVNPRGAVAFAAFILGTLLVGLFTYRRRSYILQWASGWMLVASALALLARDWPLLPLGRAAVGASQLLLFCSGLAFVVSADSFRQKPRFRKRHGWYFLPIVLWFVLSPMALDLRAVLAPGYLLTAATYTVAAVAYVLLLKRTRLVGAGAVGISFFLLALMCAWLAYDSTRTPEAWDARALGALVPAALLALAAALGMHVLVFEDITWELRQTNRRLESAHRELERLVITDPLTGCYNRRFFSEIIAREMQRRRRYHTPLSVLFVDIDKFKAVNDSLGHEAGDAALQHVAEFLRRNVREADCLFRWGGDEFLLLLTCTEEEADRKAAELRQAFARSIQGSTYPSGFGLSIGSAELPHESNDVLGLIKHADARMYREKGRGRRRRA